MKIALLSVVRFEYQIHEGHAKGVLLSPDKTTEVMIGLGMLLPDFERVLMGLQQGDSFTCALLCEQAYGKYQTEAVKALPLQLFPKERGGKTNWLKTGMQIPMQNDRGQHITGIVKEVDKEVVYIDFNHPLAGKDLYFSGKILSVREANKEEKAHLQLQTNQEDIN